MPRGRLAGLEYRPDDLVAKGPAVAALMDFSILEQALWFIVAISVLVAAHEFGQFIVARRLGFKVLRFSIGFGRPLLSWRGGPPDHIEYWLFVIPLGGYVKMLDEHEGPVVTEERHRAFHQRPVWQRVAVLLAGPAFNFLFAILAYWLMFVTGVQALKPFIAAVEPGSVAARAELKPGERSTAIGERARPTWEGATLRILDELLDDGRIDLTVREAERRDAHRASSTCVAASKSSRSQPCCSTGSGIRPGPPPSPVEIEEGLTGRTGRAPRRATACCSVTASRSGLDAMGGVPASRPGEAVEIARAARRP